jgi:hypothetical protein
MFSVPISIRRREATERTLLQRQHFWRDETKHLGEVGHG